MCVCVHTRTTRCSQINKFKKRKNLAKSVGRGVEPRRRNGQKQKGRPLAGIAEAGRWGGIAGWKHHRHLPDGKLGLGEECQVLGTRLDLL